MARHDYDEMDEDAQPSARKRRHHGDGPIIILFVIGLAGCIIGLSSSSAWISLAGVVLLVAGIVALLRPAPSREGAAASASAWRCPSCGWVFEMQVQHAHAHHDGICPHCHEHVRLEAIHRR